MKETINNNNPMTDIVALKKAEFTEKMINVRNERAAIDKKIDASNRKISWHTKRIKRLEDKRYSLDYPSWTKEYLRPILDELAKLTPDIEWNFESLSVFGLRCECPVFGRNKEQILTGITFTFNENQLYYDTGETKKDFASNTLANLNGFNNISAPVESIDTLLMHVRKVLESEKEYLNTHPKSK
ncbi:hypothetical protein POZ03_01310 [Bacteroides uniformis]|uniref:hypothetical protein n=1 Tax=Bacteroides uniformis TaxID=820 RepID=UPI00233ED719|nr:hypothetical protein [Bacteroides uniformis]MDC1809094.1 hypothetical protein [Bacteroides uniformis]